MKPQKDILIVARPDHSYQIYQALCCQKDLTFDFVCFKVLPQWISRLVNNKKLFVVGKSAHISLWTTLINLCIYKWRFKFAQKWTEDNIMDRKIRRLLRKNDYRIIHHWPTYDYKAIEWYRGVNNNVVSLADCHMPCAQVVYSEMKTVYEANKLDITNSPLAFFSSQSVRIIENEPALIVPSEYVAETFRVLFPNKEFVIVPYGIHYSEYYSIKETTQSVSSFVYVGTVSLEKGCDILLECFSQLPHYSLHIYGSIPEWQKRIFERYYSCSNIVFHGHMARSEMLSEISRYDCGIHMSRFDAYSLAVGEIIGCGLPVIVSNKTGNKDDILNYGMGIVVDIDLVSIKKAISQICQIENYRRLVHNINKYIFEVYKPYGERMVEKYKELLARTNK